MSDQTAVFNELLKQREAPPTTRKELSLGKVDDFLKEAYRIYALVTRLHTQLLDVRQAYLSTAAPRRAPHLRRSQDHQQHHQHQPPTTLTDRDREEIDANAKKTLRDLNASIRALADAEELRRSTETVVLRKKYGRGGGLVGALGAWAAGGGDGDGDSSGSSTKNAAFAAAEEAAVQFGAHREAVLWLLRQRLQEVGRTQQAMMETRLTREMEKNRSVLAKARPPGTIAGAGSTAFGGPVAESSIGRPTTLGTSVVQEEEEEKMRSSQQWAEELTEEQRQMFEKGNQDMLKHYESTLDKVRTAEQSLIEISELQTLLVGNLATQSAHIDQLVMDSFKTAENVGGGNKQLKKATQRTSPARYTFFAAAGLCLFLIGWDFFV